MGTPREKWEWRKVEGAFGFALTRFLIAQGCAESDLARFGVETWHRVVGDWRFMEQIESAAFHFADVMAALSDTDSSRGRKVVASRPKTIRKGPNTIHLVASKEAK